MTTRPREAARRRPGPDYATLAPALPDDGLDVVELFGESTPVELEIGFGRGLFLIQRAEAAPEAGLLGLEIKRKWAYKVAQRCKRLGLDRVHAYGADVRQALPALRPDASLRRVFIHFPDPWWKKRHGKRKVVDPRLLDELARLLAPGGELFVQTDVEERAAEHVALIGAHPAFELQGEGGYVDDNPYGALSNREKRAIEDGLPVYRVLARRR